MSPMLSLQAVSRAVGGRALVDAVSFEMGPGEVLAILGPSGSGKTSLLRLIAGFDAPSSGRILFDGQEASAAARVRLPPERRGLALAFQDATLFPHLDALDNVAFALRDGERGARRERARQALLEMGLGEMQGREVSSLSGGEAQRVALARALVARARLLLLDEPFGNVDRLTRLDLLARLKARLEQGSAALIITHDPADAVELGARVLLMRQARLVADASTAALAAGDCGEWARAFMAPGAPGARPPALG